MSPPGPVSRPDQRSSTPSPCLPSLQVKNRSSPKTVRLSTGTGSGTTSMSTVAPPGRPRVKDFFTERLGVAAEETCLKLIMDHTAPEPETGASSGPATFPRRFRCFATIRCRTRHRLPRSRPRRRTGQNNADRCYPFPENVFDQVRALKEPSVTHNSRPWSPSSASKTRAPGGEEVAGIGSSRPGAMSLTARCCSECRRRQRVQNHTRDGPSEYRPFPNEAISPILMVCSSKTTVPSAVPLEIKAVLRGKSRAPLLSAAYAFWSRPGPLHEFSVSESGSPSTACTRCRWCHKGQEGGRRRADRAAGDLGPAPGPRVAWRTASRIQEPWFGAARGRRCGEYHVALSGMELLGRGRTRSRFDIGHHPGMMLAVDRPQFRP